VRRSAVLHGLRIAASGCILIAILTSHLCGLGFLSLIVFKTISIAVLMMDRNGAWFARCATMQSWAVTSGKKTYRLSQAKDEITEQTLCTGRPDGALLPYLCSLAERQ
jgi:hypothetical protein